MKKVMMQYEYNGEKFEIWETKEKTLEGAWAEMDNQPKEGGWVSFENENEDEFLIVNGGFVG